MAVFNIVVNVVLAAAALVTVWFAWQAGRESRKATEAARQTAEIAKCAHDADERDRRIRQLRDIAGLVERICFEAEKYAVIESALRSAAHAWRSPEQGVLVQAVTALGTPLPKCAELAGAGHAEAAIVSARDAREEVGQALAAMHASNRSACRSAARA